MHFCRCLKTDAATLRRATHTGLLFTDLAAMRKYQVTQCLLTAPRRAPDVRSYPAPTSVHKDLDQHAPSHQPMVQNSNVDYVQKTTHQLSFCPHSRWVCSCNHPKKHAWFDQSYSMIFCIFCTTKRGMFVSQRLRIAIVVISLSIFPSPLAPPAAGATVCIYIRRACTLH